MEVDLSIMSKEEFIHKLRETRIKAYNKMLYREKISNKILGGLSQMFYNNALKCLKDIMFDLNIIKH